MSLSIKFILFQVLIIVPFIGGYFLRGRVPETDSLAKKIVMANLVLIEPPAIFWSIWGLSVSTDLLYLPAAGLAMVIAGFVLGRAFLPLLKLEGRSRATFIISSSLANHGFTMGGFLCFLFAGEKGLALSAIFVSYFIPYTFLFIFSYARRAGSDESGAGIEWYKYLINPQNMPLYAVILALLMNLFRVPRPDILFPVDLFIMISVVLYYLTLGTSFSFRDLGTSLKENALIAIIKFMILPAAAFMILDRLELSPLVESVIMIQSFMPAAVYSVVTSILFNLESRLASGIFVVNTLAFIILVLPVLFLIYGGSLL